jgi:hypothetical protein
MMFENIYIFLVDKCTFLQNLHAWLACRIDDALIAIIRKKISNIEAFTRNLADKLMLYFFSVCLATFFYVVGFFLTKFIWMGFKDTPVGGVFYNERPEVYLLTESVFATNSVGVLIYFSIYSAGALFFLLAVTRLLYLNRLFYEAHAPYLASLFWTVPLAKLIAVYFSGLPYRFEPIIDLTLFKFLVPIVLLFHPTMLFVNWLIPEIDDLLVNPSSCLRRLEAERAIYRLRKG